MSLSGPQPCLISKTALSVGAGGSLFSRRSQLTGIDRLGSPTCRPLVLKATYAPVGSGCPSFHLV